MAFLGAKCCCNLLLFFCEDAEFHHFVCDERDNNQELFAFGPRISEMFFKSVLKIRGLLKIGRPSVYSVLYYNTLSGDEKCPLSSQS